MKQEKKTPGRQDSKSAANQSSMRQKTLDFIRKHHMISPGSRVLVGLSGGADSVCLLHLLDDLSEELAIRLYAVHVHHGLRGEEADRDADFSEKISESLSIPIRIVRVNVAMEAQTAGISLEEAGRRARYRIFAEEAEQLKDGEHPVRIATAHHGDDSAETILFHLFRGSGLKGLSGIAPVRGAVIRPLLWADRAAILNYLSAEGLPCVEDSTNAENDYTRNQIRNQLLPLAVSEINSQAVQNILRAGEWIAGADRYMEKQALSWLSENERWETGALQGGRVPQGDRALRLPAAPLAGQEPVMQGFILRLAFKRLGCPLKDVTAAHIAQVLALTEKQSGKWLKLPHGVTASREYDAIRLLKENLTDQGECLKPSPPREQIIVPGTIPQEGLVISGVWPERVRMDILLRKNQGEIPKNQCTKWFDYDKIKGVLCVRYRQEGDYITLPGGGHKTLKKYFIDEKIPRQRRDQILLLAEGSHILWVIGLRISEYYKVTEDTVKILRVQIDGGK